MNNVIFHVTIVFALAIFSYSFSNTAYADPIVASNVPDSDSSEAMHWAKDENHSDLNTEPVELSLEQDLDLDLDLDLKVDLGLDVDDAIKNNELSSVESGIQVNLDKQEIPSTKDALPTLKYALPEGSIEASF